MHADGPSLAESAAKVFKVQTVRDRGGAGYGSGVLVGRELVVTNCHVTRDAVEVRILQGADQWVATLQLAMPQRDVCLLRVPGVPGEPVPVAGTAGLRPGDAVAAVGYNFGLGRQIGRAHV